MAYEVCDLVIQNKMNRRIDLRSDTCTLPSKEMRKVIYDAEVGDQGYGEDKITIELEQYCANLFGKEAALFMPSGTMSDQVALRCWTSSGDEVILDESYHLNYFQSGPSTDLGNILLNTVKTDDGVLHVAHIEERINSKMHGDTFIDVKLVSLENTINGMEGGVYPIGVLKEVYDFCRKNNIRLHMDGERFMNACVASGISPAEYATYTDTVTQSFSKGLGAPFGSIIMGTKETIDRAFRYRRWYGGHLHQSGFMAAAALYAIKNNINRLSEDHFNAKLLAKLIQDVHPDTCTSIPQTNILMMDIEHLNICSVEFVRLCKDDGVLLYPYGKFKIRAITSMNVNEIDMYEAAKKINRIIDNCKGLLVKI